MNANPHPNDGKLTALLGAARPAPALPPRFQENVWRRIEAAESPAKSQSWIDALAVLILRPRLAFATAVVLLFAGALLGAHQGAQTARLDAQARYLAVVAPNSLR
jgi:hypothetical protein